MAIAAHDEPGRQLMGLGTFDRHARYLSPRGIGEGAKDSAAGAEDMQPNATLWFRFVYFFLATFFGGFAAVFLFIVATDPFDRGHRLSLLPPGVIDESPRTANVSRGRDPRFNGAIFGNSHVQLLDPNRLSDITGFRFTQMSTPSTGPREQTVLLKWFLRNHSNIKAVVIGIDSPWCTQDPNPPLTHTFPFWLYGDDLMYFANVFGTRSLDHGWRRVLIAMGRSPVTDPAGYWNYESGRTWSFHPALLERAPVDLSPVAAPDLKFPFLDVAESVLAPLPADVHVVLVMPPVVYTGLPTPGTAAMRQIAGCKYDLVRRAVQHHWLFVDFYSDTPLSRDPENFWDESHVRMNAARHMEERIGQELSHVGYVGR
jgi:hypothetical protein